MALDVVQKGLNAVKREQLPTMVGHGMWDKAGWDGMLKVGLWLPCAIGSPTSNSHLFYRNPFQRPPAREAPNMGDVRWDGFGDGARWSGMLWMEPMGLESGMECARCNSGPLWH